MKLAESFRETGLSFGAFRNLKASFDSHYQRYTRSSSKDYERWITANAVKCHDAERDEYLSSVEVIFPDIARLITRKMKK